MKPPPRAITVKCRRLQRPDGHVGELVEILTSAGTCHTLNRPVPESLLSAVS